MDIDEKITASKEFIVSTYNRLRDSKSDHDALIVIQELHHEVKSLQDRLTAAESELKLVHDLNKSQFETINQLRAKFSELENATKGQILQWVYEDELPESLSDDTYKYLFPYSKVDTVRMFPIFAPIPEQTPPAESINKKQMLMSDSIVRGGMQLLVDYLGANEVVRIEFDGTEVFKKADDSGQNLIQKPFYHMQNHIRMTDGRIIEENIFTQLLDGCDDLKSRLIDSLKFYESDTLLDESGQAYTQPKVEQATPAEIVQVYTCTAAEKTEDGFELTLFCDGDDEISTKVLLSDYAVLSLAINLEANGFINAKSQKVEQVSGSDEPVAQRITEQDAREILDHFHNQYNRPGYLQYVNYWIKNEGLSLLDKLNQNTAHPSPNKADVQDNPILTFIEMAHDLIDEHPYLYVEIARTRQTDWMVWLRKNPNGDLIANGQGLTVAEACHSALDSLPPLKDE